MDKMPLLTPVVRKPASVELHPDSVIFNVIGPDGQIVNSVALTLGGLVDRAEENPTALLLFGVMMQMNSLRQLVQDSQNAASEVNPMDPAFIEKHMTTMAPTILKIMKDMGFAPPEAKMPGGQG